MTSTAPLKTEAPDYYFKYIDRVPPGDILGILEGQAHEAQRQLQAISEERSLFRYAPDKWSIRDLLGHINDCERLFTFRAFWFARGFDSPLPSFEDKPCAEAAEADRTAWNRHVAEFRATRESTLAFFARLPDSAWDRSGTASGSHFTVRAMAYIAAGHVTHHLAVLAERYR